jgi:hypothetical protein
MPKIVRTKIMNYSNPDLGEESINYRRVICYTEGKVYHESLGNSDRSSNSTEEQREEWREQRKFSRLYEVKNKIVQYAWCNDFDQFWTLTFAEDRYDIDKCYARLRRFLDNVTKKFGKFRYIIVAEFHKDGAVHFHGLIGDYKGPLTNSGVVQKGNEVFNLDDWKWGFTNCQGIANKTAIGAYISKYIVKSVENSPAAKGRKKYWHSDGLKTAQIEFYENNALDYLKTKYEPEWASEDGSRVIFDIPQEEFINWRNEGETFEEMKKEMPWYQENLMDTLRN